MYPGLTAVAKTSMKTLRKIHKQEANDFIMTGVMSGVINRETSALIKV